MPQSRKKQVNSKPRGFPPRKRRRKRRKAKYGNKIIKKCPLTILDLPNELFLMIFKFLPQEDLVCNISAVCQRWKDLATTFWTKIELKRNMPKEMIYKWILRAPLAKHLIIRDRRDLNDILDKVPEHLTELETIELYNCAGSRRSSRVRGEFMCGIITNCSNLSFIHLSGTRFNSCKFFTLLPQSRNLTSSSLSYLGGITYRELSVLLASAKLNDKDNPTAIGVKTITGRCRLNLDLGNISKLLDILEHRNKDRLILIMWNASKEMYNYYFNVDNLNLIDIF